MFKYVLFIYINITSCLCICSRKCEFFSSHPNLLLQNQPPPKAQGKTAEAERIFRRALEGCEEKLGARHPHTLTLMNNLAGWEKPGWGDLMGKLDEKSWWWFLLVCSVFFQKWCRVDGGHHFRMNRFLPESPEHQICIQLAYDTTKTPKFFHQKQGQLSNMTYLPPLPQKQNITKVFFCKLSPHHFTNRFVRCVTCHRQAEWSCTFICSSFRRSRNGIGTTSSRHLGDGQQLCSPLRGQEKETPEKWKCVGVFPRRVKMT